MDKAVVWPAIRGFSDFVQNKDGKPPGRDMSEALMPPFLPACEPPSHRRTSLAVGLAPLIVLLVFTGIVIGWVPADTGLAALLACTLFLAADRVLLPNGRLL
jgi:hypothetical protein